jgi:hypothetical protein
MYATDPAGVRRFAGTALMHGGAKKSHDTMGENGDPPCAGDSRDGIIGFQAFLSPVFGARYTGHRLAGAGVSDAYASIRRVSVKTACQRALPLERRVSTRLSAREQSGTLERCMLRRQLPRRTFGLAC